MNYNINMDTIVLDPNPVLRAKCEMVELPLSDEDRKTLTDMLQYVRDSKDEELAEKYHLQPAVGIAAPQIGIAKCMTAISVDIHKDEDEVELFEYALVNPKVIAHSVKKVALAGGEGCLSIREEHSGYVPRQQRIRVKAYDMIRDKEVELQLTNYLAVVFQHEIDHLNGTLFYDKIDENDPWNDHNITIIE